MMPKINYNVPITKEQQYYRYIFENHFPYCYKIIPYFWMPKYTNATDSSARTLDIYETETVTETLEYDKYEEPWDQFT